MAKNKFNGDTWDAYSCPICEAVNDEASRSQPIDIVTWLGATFFACDLHKIKWCVQYGWKEDDTVKSEEESRWLAYRSL